MTETDKVRKSHKLCPCTAMDIEGIQTWLEDMASEGLLLEKDSIFCGFWSFEKTAPRKVLYRLEVAERGGLFSDSSDMPREEILETAEAMGWEYVARYKFFYIYRTFAPLSVPLNTDPEIQALTVKRLKKERRSVLIWEVVSVAFLLLFGSKTGRYFMLSAVMLSPLFTISVLSILIWAAVSPLIQVIYLRRYEKRLKDGDSLDKRKDWHRFALLQQITRCLPTFFVLIMLFSLGRNWILASNKSPLSEYGGSTPFATAQEIVPDGTVSGNLDILDYGTFNKWSNSLSENIEWRESCDIAVNGDNYHAILYITYHDTASEWIAKRLFQDHYRSDAQRYHGKRFEDLEAPETAADDLRVYTSYGTRYVLIRHDNIVIHASVSLWNDTADNNWMPWLEATLKKLNAAIK